MSNILNSEDFGLKIYNRFPPKYREDDMGQNLALKRYLQALSDGGFRYIIQDINGLLDIKDPSRTSLDILLNLYKQYGLEVFNGIPENYLRSLLPYLSSVWKYKGSINIIEFVTTTLSGIKVSSDIKYNSYGTPIITVRLEMDFSLSDYFPSSGQFKRILENFVPFYCDLALVYAYVYSDENAIIFREFNNIDHITDTKVESRDISSTEMSKDKVNLAMDELSSSLFGFITDHKKIKYVPVSDVQSVAGVDSKMIDRLKDTKSEEQFIAPTEVHKDKIDTVVKDSINIHTMGSASLVPFEQTVKMAYTDSKSMTFIESAESVINAMSEQNATFGHAVMARARFNDKSFDKITVSY